MNEIILLLAEDEPLVAWCAEEALAEGGYTVLVAKNGGEAAAQVESRIGDLAGIVTDVCLGSGVNGWQLARRARELNPGVPIVYTTGDSAHEWSAQGVPGSILVQKPFAPAQLLTAISSLLNAAASPSQAA